MREIKFRAWGVFSKKMVLPTDADFTFKMDGGVSLYKRGEPVIGNTTHLMQYTGLKDKNGKKIYEGDIVKYEALKGQFGLHQIVYVDEAAAFLLQAITPASRNPVGMKYLGDIARSNSQYDTRTYELCEIIGNIYENPELLK